MTNPAPQFLESDVDEFLELLVEITFQEAIAERTQKESCADDLANTLPKNSAG